MTDNRRPLPRTFVTGARVKRPQDCLTVWLFKIPRCSTRLGISKRPWEVEGLPWSLVEDTHVQGADSTQQLHVHVTLLLSVYFPSGLTDLPNPFVHQFLKGGIFFVEHVIIMSNFCNVPVSVKKKCTRKIQKQAINRVDYEYDYKCNPR